MIVRGDLPRRQINISDKLKSHPARSRSLDFLAWFAILAALAAIAFTHL